ncbi:MAG TPA: hypothetical protein VIT01_05700 [Acidimicrobiales bacterium]
MVEGWTKRSCIGSRRWCQRCTCSSGLAPGEGAGQLADRCGDLARVGTDHLVFVTNGPWCTGDYLDVVLESVEPLRAVT